MNYLLLAGGAVGLHLLGVEQVRGDQLLGLPPPVAVGREPEDVAEDGAGPRGQRLVVRAQHRLSGARGRRHKRRDHAEAEQHEVVATVPGGEAPHRDMRVRTDEVKVPDQRQGRR